MPAVRLVSMETMQTVFSWGLEKDYDEDDTQSKKAQLESYESLTRTSAMNCAIELAMELIPHFVRADIELKKVEYDEIKRRADEAAKLADDCRLEEACGIFDELLAIDPFNDRLHYNLGVIQEIAGDYRRARVYYETAALSRSSEDDYREALARVESLMESVWTYRSPDVVPLRCIATMKSALKARVKGGSGERVIARAEPDVNADIVVNLPGGMDVQASPGPDGWMVVTLRDGRDVYVRREHIEIVK